MFDAHTHLQSPLLSGVLPRVIDDAARAGVTGVCCCATMPDDWSAVAELARARLPFVLVPAFGVHPWHVHIQEHHLRLFALEQLHRLAAVARLCHHRQLGPQPCQVGLQMLAQQRLVVGDQCGG